LQAQTVTDWEALVVNDGSTDDSLAVAESYAKSESRIRVLSKPNGGVSSARNHGLDHATGEFIQFLDADDVLLPRKLELQLRQFAEDAQASISVCRYKLGSHDRLEETPQAPMPLSFTEKTSLPDFIDGWEFRSSVPCHCFLFRAVHFRAGGLRFDTRLENHEDFECWVRLLSQNPKILIVDECLVIYRLNSQSMTRDHARMRRGFLAAVNLLRSQPQLSPAVQRRLRAKQQQIKRFYDRLQKLNPPGFLWARFPQLRIRLGALRDRLSGGLERMRTTLDSVQPPSLLRRAAGRGSRALNKIFSRRPLP
jgi:glycosyltransferase involved in cell wall biosynthesis